MANYRETYKITKLIFKSAPKSFIITFLNATIDALLPAFLALTIENIFLSIQNGTNWQVFIKLSFFFLLQTILSSLNHSALNAGVFETALMNIRRTLCLKLSKISPIKFEDSLFLDKIKNANLAIEEEAAPMVYYNLLNSYKASLKLISLVILMLQFSPLLFILSIISIIPIYINRKIRGKNFSRLKMKQVADERKSSIFFKYFYTLPWRQELYASNEFKFVSGKWEKINQNIIKEKENFNNKDFLSLSFCQFLKLLSYIASFLIIIVMTGKGIITIGQFASTPVLLQNLQSSLEELFMTLGNNSSNILRSKAILEILDEQEINDEQTFCQSHDKQINDLNFAYPNSQKLALDNINIDLNEYKKIALVGNNGAGKSTLAKVLLSILPSENISYPNVDCEYIPQKQIRLLMTVRDFLTLGLNDEEKNKINDSYLKEALNLVNLPNLLDKLDTNMLKDFNGLNLSGGEYQKLALAQAIVRKKSSLIFDEASSALDPITESELLTLIIEHFHDSNILMITHHLAICPSMDYILVLDNSKLIEAGTHDELIHEDGKYKKMYSAQKLSAIGM